MSGASVDAVLNFVDRDAIPGDGFSFNFDPAWSGIPVTAQRLEIRDACALDEPPTLETYGFQKARLDCTPLAQLDPAEFEHQWGAAVRERIRDLTGADAVISWAFSARFSEQKKDAARSDVSNPARRVHGDFAPTEFATEIRHSLCRDQIAEVAQGRRLARWIGFNAWQPFSPPPYDIPLAICDTRTLAPGDVVIGRGSAPSMRELELDLPLFAWNADQRWYYYSAFEPDETLLFYGIDSAGPENWRLVPHSAFDNSGVKGANPRCSVEMRCMALFF
ncbi:MAG: hypothetical protein J7496_16455 [Novosphingobium sp.]|nr:hypothetical protein [Novosphingobium sp.]